jgi:hypothetical protein
VQLEIDSTTPLYAGCTMEDTRLKVALDGLQMKAKYKWTDASVNASLKYWQDCLPDGNTCPSSLDEAKKVMCPLDLPHEKYHACINDCYIYQKEEDSNKTTCPVSVLYILLYILLYVCVIYTVISHLLYTSKSL